MSHSLYSATRPASPEPLIAPVKHRAGQVAPGEDVVPPGTFHGEDVVPPGTFHGEDVVPPGTFH